VKKALAKRKKRKHRLTTNGLTLRLMRAYGFDGDPVDQRIPFTRFTRDFLGAFDVMVFHPKTVGVMAIQCTVDSAMKSRLRKLSENPRVYKWLRTRGRTVRLIGWGLHRDGGKGSITGRPTWWAQVAKIRLDASGFPAIYATTQVNLTAAEKAARDGARLPASV
jgi:hypothetical protein